MLSTPAIIAFPLLLCLKNTPTDVVYVPSDSNVVIRFLQALFPPVYFTLVSAL